MSFTFACEDKRDKDQIKWSSFAERTNPPRWREVLRLFHRGDKACGRPILLASISVGEGPLHSLMILSHEKIPDLRRKKRSGGGICRLPLKSAKESRPMRIFRLVKIFHLRLLRKYRWIRLKLSQIAYPCWMPMESNLNQNSMPPPFWYFWRMISLQGFVPKMPLHRDLQTRAIPKSLMSSKPHPPKIFGSERRFNLARWIFLLSTFSPHIKLVVIMLMAWMIQARRRKRWPQYTDSWDNTNLTSTTLPPSERDQNSYNAILL